MSQKKKQRPKASVIDEIPKQNPVRMGLEEVGRDVRSTPIGVWLLMLLYIFLTPFLAWYFSWPWWPNFGIYIILFAIFITILTIWGRLRRSQASGKMEKAKPETKN